MEFYCFDFQFKILKNNFHFVALHINIKIIKNHFIIGFIYKEIITKIIDI